MPASADPRPPAKPDVRAFALLAGIEAVVRGIALSVFPLVMYRAWGDAAVVAKFYFVVGLLSLCTVLIVPSIARHLPRLWVYTLGVSLYLVAAVFGMVGGKFTSAALLTMAMGTATAFVCFNAYVLDHVEKADFGRLETLRLLYGGVGWTIGPVLGVWLLGFWHGAPFVIVGLAACAMLVTMWRLRLGAGRVIQARRRRAVHPLALLHRFFQQPRLVAGWIFTVVRSCGWWVYLTYVGIFAVQNGLSDKVGGITASLANAGLFMAPLMLRWMQRRSVRAAVRAGFLWSGLCFILGTLLSPLPWGAVAVLTLGSYFMVLLDVCGGLPFMMAVKPSQRNDMSAVYSSFRDVSAIVSPALVWLVLQFFEVPAVFAAAGLLMLGAWLVAGRLHPQLGVPGAQRARLRRRHA